jgi:hypothetical protein
MSFLFPGYLLSSGVSKILLILGAILLVGSLVGLVVAYRAPERIEQESSLLEYQHKGEFDYRVYLEPSYLFDSPQQDVPSEQIYPAAIVDSIDFTFHFTPTTQTPAEARIYAVLANPGIWQKEIELVPATSATGDFTASFSIDVDAINELFDVIQDETGIISSTHYVEVKAQLNTSEEELVYSLPINLGFTLIGVGSNLRSEAPGGTGEFDYVVNLKPNSIYDTETLTPLPPPVTPPDTVLEPGDIIFLKLVDAMDVTYNYTFESDKPVANMTTEIEIIATLEASDVWAKEFPLLQIEGDGSFNAEFSLDIAFYLDLLQIIASETGVLAESDSLTISAKIHTVAETQFGKIDDTFIQLMVGSLGSGILQWQEELAKIENGSIKTSQVVPNPDKLLGLSVSGAKVVFTILTIIFLLFSFYVAVLYVRSRTGGLSRVEQEIIRIKKKYRERIIEATSQIPTEGERVISLDSIEDLLGTADELGKPIIHQLPISPGDPHAYYVLDSGTRYQHLIGGTYFETGLEVRII